MRLHIKNYMSIERYENEVLIEMKKFVLEMKDAEK